MDKRLIIRSVFWKAVERIVNQVVVFCLAIYLARLLQPSDFGALALVMAIVNILHIPVDSGLSAALIQAKNTTNEDLNATAFFSFAISTIAFVLVVIFADNLEEFVKIQGFGSYIVVCSTALMIFAYISPAKAILVRQLQFKNLFLINCYSSIISSAFAIILAYGGYGVWSIIVQWICFLLLEAAFINIVTKWIPTAKLKGAKFSELFSFGWKLLVTDLLGTGFDQLRIFLVGKMYSPSALGIYSRGDQFPFFISNNVEKILAGTMYPVFSRINAVDNTVLPTLRKAVTISMFLLSPCLALLAVTAEPVVRLLLTDKWLDCVPFFKSFVYPTSSDLCQVFI